MSSSNCLDKPLVLAKSQPLVVQQIGGFHVTSSPPHWWTKTNDLSLASKQKASKAFFYVHKFPVGR